MNKKEIKDGIICPEKFGKHPKSKHRILWILKEANDLTGGGWSLTDFLAKREDPEGLFSYTRWRATFGLVIKVSYGLLNGFVGFDEIEKIDLKKASEILDYIAFINIKKVPGGSLAYLPEIAEMINPQVILKQINEINPDIVIGGNTLWILANNKLFLESKELSEESWGLFKNKILWVNAYHPGIRTITHKEYYSQIIKLAKETKFT